MLKRYKDLLRAIVAPLRTTLAGTAQADGSWQRGDLDRELERVGIAPDGTLTPIDALPNASDAERRARYAAEVAITAAVNGAKGAEAERNRAAAREEVVERAAYTWINRLLALRAMEARGLIDETLRNNPDYDGVSEALFILRSDAPARTAGIDGGWWAVIEDACQAQVEALPGLFDLNDPAAALRPSTAALLRCVALVGTAPAGYTLEEADAAFADPDAIGWAYQFYQEAAKTRVYAKLGSGGKAATRAEIAAATQLFTEPYMVQWLLQNSLGRSYHDAYPDTVLPATWAYYIRQRPEGQQVLEAPRPLHALDLIDPCCGSGHFLREAFDMFAAMYRERHPELSAAEVADRILTRHLHGIDLDPRAAQLTALVLYLRAWEFVRDDARRQRRPLSSVAYRPATLNIATTPSGLSAGALQRHLRRHPEDRVMKPLLEGVFAALEQADILGSLLRPAEHIDTAIKALQQPHTIQMDFDADDAALRRTITALANTDPAELKRMLLDRVAQSFHAEAGAADDVAAQLFGREAEGGVRLLQLLDRKYAVVVTNPPYMGSGGFELPLRNYVERHYKPVKHDLYAIFILRCVELARENGMIVMVTQRSFLNNKYYALLRQYLLENTALRYLADLGPMAFSEITGKKVSVALHIFQKVSDIYARSLFGDLRTAVDPIQKDENLLKQSYSIWFHDWYVFSGLPEKRIMYEASSRTLDLFVQKEKVDTGTPSTSFAYARRGLDTCDVGRWARFWWEIPASQAGWTMYIRGPYGHRWTGGFINIVRWGKNGEAIKAGQRAIVASEDQYFRPCATFSRIGDSGIVARKNDLGLISDSGSGVFSEHCSPEVICSFLNSRATAYLLKIINPSYNFQTGDINSLPSPTLSSQDHDWLTRNLPIIFSSARLLNEEEITETEFHYEALLPSQDGILTCSRQTQRPALYLCLYANMAELLWARSYRSEPAFLDEIASAVGKRPWSYPILPEHKQISLDSVNTVEVIDHLPQMTQVNHFALGQLKEKLRSWYRDGPGAKQSEEPLHSDSDSNDDEGEGTMSGAHIPIPTETFLEELSVKMQIHPISVYWLLEELRREGARCKPEEQRLLEDRLSVIVLRLLGHRWPRQIEAGEQVPSWADADGIIPISGGTGEQTLADRVRARLRAEDGDLHAQRTEALLQELAGLSLEDWLRREFFKRHVRQFKYRPIAWHLASDPSVAVADAKAKKRLGGRRQPAFECMVYYHACGGDVLARIRTQYVEPLMRGARQQLEQASRAKDEDGVVQANMRAQELEEFNRRLQAVAERGFASAELDKICENETLDRWTHDGFLAPISFEDFQRQEQAWRVDLNDGVRVNIAPVQMAGLLVSDVLKAADAKKAIADRARWRADERRWVRAGKLPRCGWMPDSVPESAEWTRLAPQREAERAKLEEKRRTMTPSNIR